MSSALIHEHVVKRLKAIHLIAIIVMLSFFGILFYLGMTTSVHTLPSQLIILSMATLIALDYLLLLPHRGTRVPKNPLLLFVVLNLFTTALVWATGILHSPFLILYVVLILITAQLYSYGYGLLQTLLSIAGFVLIYGATVARVIPYQSLLPYESVNLLFQPTAVVLTYGLLYTILLLFTVVSSSSARVMVFKPHKHSDLDTTYQEKIIQEMPLGILILDSDLHILGSNAKAEIDFPYGGSAPTIAEYLTVPKNTPHKKLIKQLSKTTESRELAWKLDTGQTKRVVVSARTLKGAGRSEKTNTLIVFLQDTTVG